MARNALLVDFKEECIAVAVDEDAFNRLEVPRCFSFAPTLLTASAVVHHPPRLQSFGKRFPRHIGDHEDCIAFRVLGYCKDEATLIEFDGVEDIHTFQYADAL